jgi:aromatic-L-amino-acid decarboxylase
LRAMSMFAFDETMTELVLDYARRRLAAEPQTLGKRADPVGLNALLEGAITPGGRDPGELLELFEAHLAAAVIPVDTPRFLAFIPAAPTQASRLFDMVISAACIEGTSWLLGGGAVAAENQVLRLLADLAGLPAEAGGVFVSGGSAANLSALLVARDTAVPRDAPRVAVSDQAHSSVAKALHVLGLEALVVPTSGRLTEAELRAAVDETVIAIVATAGTTNAGIVDDLAGAARVAGELGAWLHVDAAYGGAALLVDSVRERFAGIEHADSLVVDPHKWLMAPFDAAALLYREPHLARAVHTQDASYLDPLRAAETEAEWNPSDYAYQLTRRARGLPLWFSLAVNGTDAYRDAIARALALARDCARRITETPGLELVREPDLSTVLFRRSGWAAVDYERWWRRLLADDVAFVAPSTWEGAPVARLTFVHPETSMEIVQPVLDAMLS